jgi:Fur family ferric uptake transcriptional regulator
MPTARRVTRPRTLITEELKRSDAFSTAQTIFTNLSKRGKRVGIATVYRNLQSMAEHHEVDTVQDHGETFYRLCKDRHHHHHLVCRQCGRAVELEIPGLESWIQTRAESLGFSEVSHSLEIFGICARCSRSHESAHHQLSD